MSKAPSGHPQDAREVKEVKIEARERLFQGYFAIDSYRLRHTLFGGGLSPRIQREVFERGHAAALLPYDPVADTVVLIEQFRIGAHAAGLDPWLVEIVAGIIEDGENAEELVHREASEEANCRLLALEPMGTYLLSPGGSSETMTFFCGKVDSRGLGGIHGLSHEGEDIRAFVSPWEDACAALKKNLYHNATTVLALQWLSLNREKLRRKWLSESAEQLADQNDQGPE